MEYDNNAFARNLKVERAKKGWNQNDLADASGVSQATIARYELGSVVPGLEQALKIARAFGCSIDSLVNHDVKEGD